MSLDEVARQVDALIVTRGARGSTVYTRDGHDRIKAAEPDKVLDPTGCGDAYRAGLIHGILNDFDLVTSARIGAVMGAIKIAQRGAQNHAPSREEIEARFRRAFGYSPWKG